MRIIGLIAILTLILLAMGDVTLFFNMPSVLIVLGGTIGMLLWAGASIGSMFKAVFSGNATLEELQAGVNGWRLARVFTIAAGVMGTVIGLILMLHKMDDPAAIGPAMAVAMLTTFYGIVLSFAICLPLQARLQERAEEASSE